MHQFQSIAISSFSAYTLFYFSDQLGSFDRCKGKENTVFSAQRCLIDILIYQVKIECPLEKINVQYEIEFSKE